MDRVQVVGAVSAVVSDLIKRFREVRKGSFLPTTISFQRVLGLLALAMLGAAGVSHAQTKATGGASPTGPTAKIVPDKKQESASEKSGEKAVKPEKNAYDYSLPGVDGKDVPMASFKGKYVVLVNLARKSMYNDQLPALIKMNDMYKAKGVVVIGVPSNDFGASEPGTNAEIQKAYADAKVNFAIMSVSKLSGDDTLPLYLYLTKGKDAPAGGPVPWNYTKFVIDKNGKVVTRLNSDVAPDSPEMLSTLDQVLDGTFKPKKAGGKPDAAAAGQDGDD